MNNKRITLGRAGEDTALDFLQKSGFKILERNYKCRYGEIDIIAEHKSIIAFIEVKTRKNISFGVPQMAVDFRKQRQISKAAMQYIKVKKVVNTPLRFDVVAITLADNTTKIEHIKDAFEICI